ncbi:RNA polymerase II subunit 5-mediating protein-like isoform D, partial [Glycine soja]
VPFGKAAFFPGCLIHTNEYLVLLGEGYYAERTSKQTVEILQQRRKSLDSRVDSLEANIKDPQAEASFLNATTSFLVARFFWEKGIMLNF